MANSASGFKTMIINQRERGVSNDLNRLQRFAASEVADALSYLFDYEGSDVANSGGFGSVGSTTASPLRAMILGGLCVRPQMASVNTLVDPGVIVAVVTPTDADDSPYRLVDDPGVTNPANLTLPGNATGLTRIYVVECSVVETVIETDNRDVFNPGTGLFAPALVNKVVASRLTYRIRTGTLAAGVTTSSGWLPLMVALVPTAAATWDDVAFMWDVRPLVSDRVQTPLAAMTTTVSRIINSDCELFDSGGGAASIRGRIDAIGPSGRRLGGDLAYSPADAGVDLTSTSVAMTGFAPAALGPLYLWSCEPFGLPRWCRYTSVASGNRLPGRCRGMLVASDGSCAPWPVKLQNGQALPLPSAFGFPASAAAGTAALLWAGMADGAGAPLPYGIGNGVQFTQDQAAAAFAASSKDADAATWTIVPGVHYPKGVRALHVRLEALFGAGAATTKSGIQWSVEVLDEGTNHVAHVAIGNNCSHATDDFDCAATVRIPISTVYPTAAAPTTSVVFTYTGSQAGYAVAPTFTAMTITGWEF